MYPVCGTATSTVDRLAVFEWGLISVHCSETSHICSIGLESRLKPWDNLPSTSFGLTSLPGKSAVAESYFYYFFLSIYIYNIYIYLFFCLKSIWYLQCSPVMQSTNYDGIGCYTEGIQTLFTFTCIDRHRIKLHIKYMIRQNPRFMQLSCLGAPPTHSSPVQHSEGAKVHSWTHHYNCIN